MVNHAVTIVGWDDNYKKENFIDGPKPSRNGAWIVKTAMAQASVTKAISI